MLKMTKLVKDLRDGALTTVHMMGFGGGWLGAARSWIQWNCINGSDVTWVS